MPIPTTESQYEQTPDGPIQKTGGKAWILVTGGMILLGLVNIIVGFVVWQDAKKVDAANTSQTIHTNTAEAPPHSPPTPTTLTNRDDAGLVDDAMVDNKR